MHVPPDDIYPDNWDEENVTDIIQLFWWCSLTDEWKWFEFKEAFATIESILKEKLGKNFCLPEEEQEKLVLNKLSTESQNEKESFLHRINNHIINLLSKEEKNELTRRVFTEENFDSVKYRFLKEEINGRWFGFNNLEKLLNNYPGFKKSLAKAISRSEGFNDEIYQKLQNYYVKLQRGEWSNRISFFDELIHLEHHCGDVLEWHLTGVNCDSVEELREVFEDRFGLKNGFQDGQAYIGTNHYTKM